MASTKNIPWWSVKRNLHSRSEDWLSCVLYHLPSMLFLMLNFSSRGHHLDSDQRCIAPQPVLHSHDGAFNPRTWGPPSNYTDGLLWRHSESQTVFGDGTFGWCVCCFGPTFHSFSAADGAYCPGLSSGYKSRGKVNRVVGIYVGFSLLPRNDLL